MIYGCIGEHLSHSYSAEIHRLIGNEPYELKEIEPENLGSFLREGDFCAVNVTIPYKEAVIPYLAEMSPTARAVGAVNTIIRHGDGTLSGYNTDVWGLTALFRHAGIDPAGRKALILGTGGTSKTALYTLRGLGAREILRVSRSGREGAVTYEEALEKHRDAEIIVNATPCGMYPEPEGMPLDPDAFPALRGVADAIYNPLRSRLILRARARGIPAEGGLYMLAAQAVKAAELFRGRTYPGEMTEDIYRRVLRGRENAVLIGMPGSGKSSAAAALARRLGREWADTDSLIVRKTGMEITEIFRRFGEARFRELESHVIRDLSCRTGLVIATGGGAVLKKENLEALRRNGRLFLLDRPLGELLPTSDRPLADSEEKLLRLYRERMPLYRAAADEIIPTGRGPEETAQTMESRWNA